MKQIYTAHISTLIAKLFRACVPSSPFVTSLDCAHCGLKANVRGGDGTSGFTCEIRLLPQNLSVSRHVVALTPDGKLSISCVSSPSDARLSDPPSGNVVGTSSSPTNSPKRRVSVQQWEYLGADPTSGGQPCGCDPVADYMCDHHKDVLTIIVMTACLYCGKLAYDCECAG